MIDTTDHIHDNKFSLALGIISCLVGNEKCIYASTPITNGLRMIEWRRKTANTAPTCNINQNNHYHESVIIPNCDDGKIFASKLRKTTSSIVIDPSHLHIDGWSQSDYLELWSCVIKKFAYEVRFNDGWEYSNGCAHEYVVASQHGIPVKNKAGHTISIDDAAASLSASIPLLKEVGINTDAIKATFSKIMQLK